MPARAAVHKLTLGLAFLTMTSLAPPAHAADSVSTNDPPSSEDKADAAEEGLPLIAIEGEAEVQMDAGFGMRPRSTASYATV
jgi:hypothetical protein